MGRFYQAPKTSAGFRAVEGKCRAGFVPRKGGTTQEGQRPFKEDRRREGRSKAGNSPSTALNPALERDSKPAQGDPCAECAVGPCPRTEEMRAFSSVRGRRRWACSGRVAPGAGSESRSNRAGQAAGATSPAPRPREAVPLPPPQAECPCPAIRDPVTSPVHYGDLSVA